MATEVMDSGRVQKFFEDIDTKKSAISTCIDLYKTLISDFSSLERSLNEKSKTLDFKIQTLESESEKALELIQQRENSLPVRESSLSSSIEVQKQAALSELENPSEQSDELSENLKSVCRRMDHSGLLKLVISKRKESVALKGELANALLECVDAPRLVLDAVEDFVNQKASGKTTGGGGGVGSGLTDRRWACGMVVNGLFSPDDLKEGKNAGPSFAGSVVERASRVVDMWKDKVEESGEALNRMGPVEASMFLQLMVVFGFKEKFDDAFLKKVVLEFAAWRDMAKLAVPIFGEKVGDVIDELVKIGKEIEAIYFASESGLTDRFHPIGLIKSYLRNSKKNATAILKNGNYSTSATYESNNLELNSIRTIIRCVEEHNLEAEFPLDSLRKRQSLLERAKADKKKRSSGGGSSKPSRKRLHGSITGGSRGPPPPRPSKVAKFSNPYPPFGRRNTASPAQQSPVVRYSGPYNYANQTAYEAGPASATAYATTTYGGAHAPASAPIPQQHYALQVDNASAGDARVGGSYGPPMGYASYDYGATTGAPTYQPPTYTQ
ncbi:hypothetical protein Nepgr_019867 [Nepenthes gracilis]|uniref:FRIGIDA-like protein n=1 Tax=Nepenthes gracilis TaxID=150966 RepID=A0AAD3SW44_NEPGR|nr:hypothetical protein Nepgr_019867 [Nepenthes gracilis]